MFSVRPRPRPRPRPRARLRTWLTLLVALLTLPALAVLTTAPASAAGRQTAGAASPAVAGVPDSSFQKVLLNNSGGNPLQLDIASDGRVFFIDMLGDVRIINTSGTTVTAGHLDVFTANESGLLAMALDPAFATNHWIYVYYSPAATSVDRLSRFTVNGSTLDMTSEKVVLDVPVQRAECCHHGAGMAMDHKNGNLWLSIGDNTNPFASDGYAPIDEQAGRATWDAQRTAGNTNSLSGKVLRIHPEANGTYTVPAGNLFPAGTAKTRPEIYAMGYRNPFRLALDPKTGFPVVGNYGPDAGGPNAGRGPENTVEWDLLSKPVNAGWPYCIGNNTPYIDYNFATQTSGAPFDCAGGPTNNSPNNTGLTKLPPATPATVWYHYNTDANNFPLLSGGAPMAGPVYRYDANLASDRKWPAAMDGQAIFSEWNTSKVYTFHVKPDSSGIDDMQTFLPSVSFKKPMDMKFGPDGALYMVEWGTGYGGNNADAGIYRIDYLNGGALPVAAASANRTSGPAPLAVNFSSSGSNDPAGGSLSYKWAFGDGATSTTANPSHTYTAVGNYTAVLTVTNSAGKSATASLAVTAGNTMPTLTVNGPPNGGVFDWGDKVNFAVTVTDPEDGTVDCGQVKIQAILGHDTHGHPLDQYTGCSATVSTTLSNGHSDGDNVFYVIEATYTDKGGSGGAAPLTGRAQITLQPKHKQAEFFTDTGRTTDGQGTDTPGVTVESGADSAGGGQDIGFIEDGDYWSLAPIALNNVTAVQFRTASANSGGRIEVRWNAPNGPLLGTATVPSTGAWQTYTDVTANLSNVPTGSGKVYFVARNPSGHTGPGALMNANWEMFVGAGVGTPGTPGGGTGISLKAHANGKYVTAPGAGAQPLIAASTTVGTAEKFDEIDLGGGNIALRAHANNQYVTAENGGAASLIANRAAQGLWETFALIHNSDGSVSLKAAANGSYVTAENAGAQPLIANRAAIGPWEEFDLSTA
ncbi:PQQ-dependent sugar dehydrogenase [Streptomyces sp. NBC_01477]|uniref:PQQ-dependent sugar dehydrogenase n=1 Tax=Streptomyces sp. NBC_01477 TaxID=2976015 RepID=UPI002E347F6D|nr:PQQ-dependent sugar dehydrogenase [Streptomyces sp. NBC_01477]